MFDAATAPAETRQPDPPRAVPPQLGKVLSLVRTFIAYARNLADTLRQHAADPHVLPSFASIAITFATSDVAAILARLTRGLLRAAALEERLHRRAARGKELKPTPICPPRSKPRAARPATPPHDPAPDSSPASPPTLEQILAQDRRRPIGAVLVGICHDLGIMSGRMGAAATWEELQRAIILYGGSIGAFLSKRPCWRISDDPAAPPIDSAGQPIIVFPPRPGAWGRAPAFPDEKGPARSPAPLPPMSSGSSRGIHRPTLNGTSLSCVPSDD